ncbi:MAG: threonine aldolase family protein, partial [Eubacteriaceae bacterium]
MNKIIDLRSDTVTKPTEEMRKAMSSAIVGDDVYKDDPTVNELEKYAAIVMGKQSAIFVPSGTMGNQICIKTHTNPGEEIILHRKSHIFVYELGAPAIISGVLTKLLDGKDGAIDIKELISGIQEGDMHHAKTTLICMENTHNVCGGTIVSVEHMKKVYDIAKENNIKVHLDGARIFNAAAALGVDACEIAKYCDSVMFCLSKGLGAPVGSMICGDVDFIKKAM